MKDKISTDIEDNVCFSFQKYLLGTQHSVRTDCTSMGKEKAMGKSNKSTFNHINKLVSKQVITAHKS